MSLFNQIRIASVLPAALVAALLPAFSSAASLNIYLSPPGDQASSIAGATTEDFNSLATGVQSTPYTSSIGTYQFSSTAHFASLAADQYGGAGGSRYVSLGAQSHSSAPVTLALDTPANYFGFWWSAGDRNNGLSFYYNDSFITRLTTADIVNLLSANGGTVTAINGSTYSKAGYYGNPNNHLDANEPFSYVNIFASDTGFNRIVFDNSGLSSSGFETDNHSVRLSNAKPSDTSVFVKSVTATEVVVSPEPVSLSLSGLGALGLFLLLGRRKRF